MSKMLSNIALRNLLQKTSQIVASSCNKFSSNITAEAYLSPQSFNDGLHGVPGHNIDTPHVPVMVNEVLSMLDIHPGIVSFIYYYTFLTIDD